ncbi:hypothetical protein CBR_g11057 [Chara braunii]|uniref:CRM domain-containing protein n=1 Tax=Chara braunii TaxID=69332 RepID=A0A388KPY8_CHABU|nr:hypothetical protein CBR_g11057 [Chara braunii]|eukprot:GBG72124.1 hypothetical protein CBR_g11057 [Chara braunii]
MAHRCGAVGVSARAAAAQSATLTHSAAALSKELFGGALLHSGAVDSSRAAKFVHAGRLSNFVTDVASSNLALSSSSTSSSRSAIDRSAAAARDARRFRRTAVSMCRFLNILSMRRFPGIPSTCRSPQTLISTPTTSSSVVSSFAALSGSLPASGWKERGMLKASSLSDVSRRRGDGSSAECKSSPCWGKRRGVGGVSQAERTVYSSSAAAQASDELATTSAVETDQGRRTEEGAQDALRSERNTWPSDWRGFPALGARERKELRAYANGLGKSLVVWQIGKSGISNSVVSSVTEALEANELIKVKILDNCEDDVSVVADKLERKTKSQVVGKVGRTLLLYRPSLRKAREAAAADSSEVGSARRGRSGPNSRYRSGPSRSPRSSSQGS